MLRRRERQKEAWVAWIGLSLRVGGARSKGSVFNGCEERRGQTQNSHNTFQSALGPELVRYGRKDDEARSAEWEKMRCM